MYVASSDMAPGANGNLEQASAAESLSDWINSAVATHRALNSVLEDALPLPQMSGPAAIRKALPKWLTRIAWKRLPFGVFADTWQGP